MEQFLREQSLKGIKYESIVHVGASSGQEVDAYVLHGAKEIILVEPLPNEAAKLRTLANLHTGWCNIEVIEALALAHVGYEKLHVTSNSVSSSIFGKSNPNMHTIDFVNEITVECDRLDNMLIDKMPYIDLLVIDAQGSEHLVLKGADKDVLESTGTIYIEASETPLYEGACTYKDIEAILLPYGFKLQGKYYNERGTGDAIFVR
jgi:FkbM family methyltransferase